MILDLLFACNMAVVSYFQAEELMKKVENDEEIQYIDEKKKSFHLCIINLVIGTLYCSKGNYEFGISRVIKALEPFDEKLGTDTWYYSKRCLVSAIENLSKHIISIRDSIIDDCLHFLEQCEIFGKQIPTVINGPLMDPRLENAKSTVTYEARLLRALLLEVVNY
ncbi:unnamed protein product [Dracunculus medinensis]|uniref:Tetratricopeptide repeat protein 30 n=1 Tax=Dracunculus medinensis TaxID=318479 RepID=A0A0N4UG56_DRAME|nr:unnamed protein product [Dracunculus medinensis]